MNTHPEVPQLRVVTRALSAPVDLLSFADPQQPLLWLRGDRGCVGIGETLRLEFTGAERFDNAARQWREIAAAADIDDPLGLPGTGLVALGSFAFAADSQTTSVLIVPRTLIARHREQWWITEMTRVDPRITSAAPSSTIDVAHPTHAVAPVPTLPEPTAWGQWPGVSFAAAPESVDAYLTGVAAAVDLISDGACEKVVIARQLVGTLPRQSDLRVPLSRLAERYLDCWTFAVDGFIGASPETLIRSTDGALSARVLAGTRARHGESESRDAQARDELVTSEKEQHEHAFAVQSVVTALSPHVSELHTSDSPFPLQLPNVWHLATDLGAQLAQHSSSLELVGALHPTAAVAGTPTLTAIAAIAALEPNDRGRYSGAVGWIDDAGDGEWVIGLRCAQVNEGAEQVVASAGGGIVAGSDPSHELSETVSKFRPITEAFAR